MCIYYEGEHNLLRYSILYTNWEWMKQFLDARFFVKKRFALRTINSFSKDFPMSQFVSVQDYSENFAFNQISISKIFSPKFRQTSINN